MPPSVLNARHRVPVRWSLYRPLLRLAKPLQLAAFVERLFRRNLAIQNLGKVQRRLLEAIQMLHELRELPGDPKLQHKYAALAARQATLQAAIPPPPPTPAYVHPVRSPGVIFSTPYNPPLPRLKPQPLGISMMIFNRRAAIQRRWDRFAVLKDWESDLREEDSFLARVGVQGQGGYVKVLREQLSDIKESFQREAERNKMRIGPELQQQAVQANKHREQQRATKARWSKT